MKEKSTGDEDSLDPIAEFLDRAHEKEGVVAYKIKQSTLHQEVKFFFTQLIDSCVCCLA